MAHSISSIKIANMALSKIGARSSIESFDEPSAEAKQCKLWYDYARVCALEAHDWSFARRRILLADHSADPASGVWAFRYQYPSDCIAARYLENPLGPSANAVPYEIEVDDVSSTKSILTDLETATLVYTFDQSLTSLFSSAFVDALSYKLGEHIAFSLTGKLQIEQRMAEQYFRSISLAAMFDANEEIPREPREAEWIRGRA